MSTKLEVSKWPTCHCPNHSKIFEECFYMDDNEFDILIGQNCILIGKQTIIWAWEGKEITDERIAYIFGLPGTTTFWKNNSEREAVFSFYLRYRCFVWRAHTIAEALTDLEAIRLHELEGNKIKKIPGKPTVRRRKAA